MVWTYREPSEAAALRLPVRGASASPSERSRVLPTGLWHCGMMQRYVKTLDTTVFQKLWTREYFWSWKRWAQKFETYQLKSRRLESSWLYSCQLDKHRTYKSTGFLQKINRISLTNQQDFSNYKLLHKMMLRDSHDPQANSNSTTTQASTFYTRMLNIFYPRTQIGFHVEPDPDIRRRTCFPFQLCTYKNSPVDSIAINSLFNDVTIKNITTNTTMYQVVQHK